MSFEPLRFVHASDLCLDHQLADTGALPEDLHASVQDATVAAFASVVSVCIERQADFLLLGGNTFDHRDRSVRAPATLLSEFARLAEHDVNVFVVPGELDPDWAWRDLPLLPDNVMILSDLSEEPVDVLRDGRVIATICADVAESSNATESESGRAACSSRRGPLAIAIKSTELTDSEHKRSRPIDNPELDRSLLPEDLTTCSVNYLALSGAGARRTIPLKSGVAHHPGGTQAVRPQDTGPHGCTLVDVDSQGEIKCRLCPTGAVRWETFVLRVDERSSREALIARMTESLRECRPEEREQAWLNRWTIQGLGPLFELLHDDEARDRFLAVVGNTHPAEGRVRMVHDICLLPDADALELASQSDRFAGEYFELLREEVSLVPQTLGLHLAEAQIPDAGRLHSLVAELDPDVVAGHARRLGMTLFGVTSEEGSPHEDHRYSH